MNHLQTLTKNCEDLLIDSLTPALRAKIDRALAAGSTAKDILKVLRRLTGGPQGRVNAAGTDREGGMTFLAVEAYLARKSLTKAAKLRIAADTVGEPEDPRRN